MYTQIMSIVSDWSGNQPSLLTTVWYCKLVCLLFAFIYTLQKQVGCFNHRVVTLVVDKLERQWL